MGKLRINTLRAAVDEIDVEYQGDSVHIFYRPSEYTPKFEREFQDLMDASRPANAMALGIVNLVVSWDVEDEDGSPWPPSAENLDTVTAEFLAEIFGAISRRVGQKFIARSEEIRAASVAAPTTNGTTKKS